MASDKPKHQDRFTKLSKTVSQKPGETFGQFIQRLTDLVEAEEQKERDK